MVELDGLAGVGALILVNERECGTCDLVGISGVKRLGNALDHGGLPCPEIAAEDEEFRRLEEPGDLMASADGFGSVAALELVNLPIGGSSGHRASMRFFACMRRFLGSPCNQRYPP